MKFENLSSRAKNVCLDNDMAQIFIQFGNTFFCMI